MAKGASGGKRAAAKNTAPAIKYLSADNALYESQDEVLFVERRTSAFLTGEDVLEAKSDGAGNIKLDYADPVEYYDQNSKTKYGLYELRSGITNTADIHGSRWMSNWDTMQHSNVKSDNDVSGIRSVGIDWDKVKSVSGNTYNVKDLLKSKGFKWNGAGENWVKP